MKIESILIDNIYRKYIYVVNGIDADGDTAIIPATRTVRHLQDYVKHTITHIGYQLAPDTRTERERFEDEYRFYVPQTNSLKGIEVTVSENVKKIVIPETIANISKEAFKNVRGLTFEIDGTNEIFEFKDGKLINKETNGIIYES